MTFRCVGEYTYSNLWIQRHEKQYEECNCMAVPDEPCDILSTRNGYCAPDANSRELVVQVLRIDGNLGSVISFEPGPFYFASYADVGNLTGALSDNPMGGQCEHGLRLALLVTGDPIETMTTPETTNQTTQDPEVSEPYSTTGGDLIDGQTGGIIMETTTADTVVPETEAKNLHRRFSTGIS